jgi:hypothetical protein
VTFCPSNGSVTMDISMATIDREGYKRKATDSFKRVQRRESTIYLGNQLVIHTNKSSSNINNTLQSSHSFPYVAGPCVSILPPGQLKNLQRALT